MRYGIVGHSGRMGREIASVFAEAGHELTLAVDERGGDSCSASGAPQVIVDFSRPAALDATLALCGRHDAALVLGTTGLDDAQLAAVRLLAKTRAVVQSANFGTGINLMAMILRDYAEMLGDWTMEIVDVHHDKKVDAPSGTALMLMESTGRTCPVHSLRLGNLPGDHTVHFSNGDELLSFSHRIVNRTMLARGALCAAEFASGAKAGFYTFQDVLRAAGAKKIQAGGISNVAGDANGHERRNQAHQGVGEEDARYGVYIWRS